MNKGGGKHGFYRTVKIIMINVLVTLVLLELTLHLIPSRLTGYRSNITYVSDKYLGYIPEPNQDGAYINECLRVPHVLTNSDGMRGGAWTDTASPRIALLGDSYLLAYTISENLHLARLLKSATRGEIWNAGVSGYGTYQELLIWRKLIRNRAPDITIIFVFLENDIRDNQCALCRSEGQIYSPCCEVTSGGISERTDFVIREKPSALKAWFKENCFTCRLINNLMKPGQKHESGNYFDKESFAYNVYRPGFSRNWDDGWQIMEWSLRSLKKACDSVGSDLLVVNVPGPIRLGYDLKAEIKNQLGSDYLPPGFDEDYPTRRLCSITEAAGIGMLDLRPEFIRYRDRYQLQNPVFGYCCDGHWNPVGHQLASDLVYNHLLSLKWIKGSSSRVTPAPADILGRDLFDQIYNCRTVELK